MNRSLHALLLPVVLFLCARAYGQPTSESPGGKEKFTTVPARDTAAARFDQGRKWAVVVGVNKYLGTGIPALKYCVADAKLVSKQLVERCGYDEKRVLTLTDDQEAEHLRPLRINLDQQLRGWLSLAATGDTVLVYFSGHGFLDARGQGFLAPKDCQLDNLGLSALRTDDLRDMLRQCKATQKVLVLDCCHAGAGKGEGAGSSSQELGGVFKSAEGLVTIASCRKSETSQEWEKKGQGVFTYFLSSGLGGAADYDRNGIVDNLELYRYVADEVPTTAQRELNAVQMPVQIIGDDVAGVFALSRVSASTATVKPPSTVPAEMPPRTTVPKPSVKPPLGSIPGTVGLTGRFIYDGVPPKPEPLVVEKDVDAFGKLDLVDESLIVGSDGGIANVVVWVRTDDVAVPTELAARFSAKVEYDNKGGRFVPHILSIWVGKQTLVLKNSDPVAHNVNIQPLGSEGINPLLVPGTSVEHQFDRKANLPQPIGCNVHPWMRGYVLLRDNPYYSVSDDSGDFAISGLPKGTELEFQVWHERAGYLSAKSAVAPGDDDGNWVRGRFKLTLTSDVDLGEIKVDSSLFNK